MMLLVDMGNSALKWAIADTDGLHPGGRCYWGDVDPAGSFDSLWTDQPTPDRVVVASVAGDAMAAVLRQNVARRWGVEAEFLRSAASARGVVNAYAEPERLGVDRWAALIAAKAQSNGPVCVVDCGTAVTVDVLDAEGVHLGGLIVPGLGLMRGSLKTDTQMDATAEPQSQGRVSLLAADTYGAVQGGSLYMLVAYIDRVLNDVTAALGSTPGGLITGGDAGVVLPLLAGRWRHAPDLVLEGVALLSEEGVCES